MRIRKLFRWNPRSLIIILFFGAAVTLLLSMLDPHSEEQMDAQVLRESEPKSISEDPTLPATTDHEHQSEAHYFDGSKRPAKIYEDYHRHANHHEDMSADSIHENALEDPAAMQAIEQRGIELAERFFRKSSHDHELSYRIETEYECEEKLPIVLPLVNQLERKAQISLADLIPGNDIIIDFAAFYLYSGKYWQMSLREIQNDSTGSFYNWMLFSFTTPRFDSPRQEHELEAQFQMQTPLRKSEIMDSLKNLLPRLVEFGFEKTSEALVVQSQDTLQNTSMVTETLNDRIVRFETNGFHCFESDEILNCHCPTSDSRS